MLRTCLIQSRIIANGTPLYGFYLRRPRLCIAGKALHNKAPPPSNLGSSPPINPPDDLQFPNSFVELVEFARSVEKARKMAVDENGSNFEPNKGKGKGKKKKKKSQAKGDKSEKQKSRSEHEEGNEHIVTALIEAINKDYWPDIIYYSTLHPQHLQGWHPEESECLARHRMSMALSELPEGKLDSICDHRSVLSVEKLARIWAKKRLDQVDYIPGVDYDEDLLAMDIPWPAGPNKPKEPWTFKMNGFTLKMEPNNNKTTGSDGSARSDDSDKPGSAHP